MLNTLYVKYIKRKLFNKIFIAFSIATVISFLLFAYMASINICMYFQNKVMEINEQVLENTYLHTEQKINASKDMVDNLYTNTILYNEIHYLMENGYNKHLQYKMDKLFNSGENKYNGFENYFDSWLTRDSDMIGIGIYSSKQNEAFIYANKSRVVYTKDNGIIKYLNEFGKDTNLVNIIPSHTVNYLEDRVDKTAAFSVAFRVKEKFTSKTLGFIMIDYRMDGLSQALQSVKNFQGNIVVQTHQGEVIFETFSKESGGKIPRFIEELKGNRIDIDIYKHNIIETKSSDSTGILTAVILSKQTLSTYSSRFQKTVFLVVVCFIMGVLIFARFAVGTFSRRIDAVTEGIKKIRQGDLSSRIALENNEDELSEIALSFNGMCEDLKEYIDKVYISEIRQKNAQIKELQAQINPHFLYNTLESIRMRALVKGDREVGDMIYLLASFFRRSIKGKMVISISEEIKYSKMYLELHNLKSSDKVMVTYDISDEILDFGIMKHTLQPVIENYIIHGINLNREDNELIIKAYKATKDIYIHVKDNGNGIQKEKLDAIKDTLQNNRNGNLVNVGIVNVHERIQLFFGKEYGLKVESRERQGTDVVIRIPALPKGEMENGVQSVYSG